MYYMETSHPKNTQHRTLDLPTGSALEQRLRNRGIANRRREEMLRRRGNTIKVIAATLGAAVLGGVVLHNAHVNDQKLIENAEAAQSATKPVSVLIEASDEHKTKKAEAGDTVGSIVKELSDVNTADAAKIPEYVAFDAAVDTVMAMPENAKVLEDGTLQIDERLTVPAEMTAKEAPDK